MIESVFFPTFLRVGIVSSWKLEMSELKCFEVLLHIMEKDLG
jgi:hypothetical protein